jgi:hypothetical protein
MKRGTEVPREQDEKARASDCLCSNAQFRRQPIASETPDCVGRGENGSLGNSAFAVTGYVIGQYDGDAWLEKD